MTVDPRINRRKTLKSVFRNATEEEEMKMATNAVMELDFEQMDAVSAGEFIVNDGRIIFVPAQFEWMKEVMGIMKAEGRTKGEVYRSLRCNAAVGLLQDFGPLFEEAWGQV